MNQSKYSRYTTDFQSVWNDSQQTPPPYSPYSSQETLPTPHRPVTKEDEYHHYHNNPNFYHRRDAGVPSGNQPSSPTIEQSRIAYECKLDHVAQQSGFYSRRADVQPLQSKVTSSLRDYYHRHSPRDVAPNQYSCMRLHAREMGAASSKNPLTTDRGSESQGASYSLSSAVVSPRPVIEGKADCWESHPNISGGICNTIRAES